MTETKIYRSLIVIKYRKKEKVHKIFINTIVWECYCLKDDIEPYSFEARFLIDDLIRRAEKSFFEANGFDIDYYDSIVNGLILNSILDTRLFEKFNKWSIKQSDKILNFPEIKNGEKLNRSE